MYIWKCSRFKQAFDDIELCTAQQLVSVLDLYENDG